MVTVKVVCPFCRQTIEYNHEEDGAWGIVSQWDFAVVELTAHDKGKIHQHISENHTQEEILQHQKNTVEQLQKRVNRG